MHRHDGAIDRAGIAPRFEKMGRRQMGRRRRVYRGRFVDVIAETNHFIDRFLQGHPIEVGGRVVGGISAEDHQSFDRAAFESGRQTGKGRDPGGRFVRDKRHRLTDGTNDRVEP